MNIFTPHIPYTKIKFSDNCEHIQLLSPENLPTQHSINFDSWSADSFFELAFVLDAMNNVYEESYKKGTVTLNLSYYPFARQDRYCALGQSSTKKVFTSLLNEITTSNSSIIFIINILDVHSDVHTITNRENVFVNKFSQIETIQKSPDLVSIINQCETIIAPDSGSKDKANQVAGQFNHLASVYCTKTRDPESGYLIYDELNPLYNSRIKNKHILVCDDICDGGMTFILLANAIAHLKPKSMTLIVSHGIFSKGTEELEKYYDRVIAINDMR